MELLVGFHYIPKRVPVKVDMEPWVCPSSGHGWVPIWHYFHLPLLKSAQTSVEVSITPHTAHEPQRNLTLQQ